MAKTKLDMSEQAHMILVAAFATMVDDFGYSPRDLYELIDNSKKELYFGLQEMHLDNTRKEGANK